VLRQKRRDQECDRDHLQFATVHHVGKSCDLLCLLRTIVELFAFYTGGNFDLEEFD
jgi:hypothetical protein